MGTCHARPVCHLRHLSALHGETSTQPPQCSCIWPKSAKAMELSRIVGRAGLRRNRRPTTPRWFVETRAGGKRSRASTGRKSPAGRSASSWALGGRDLSALARLGCVFRVAAERSGDSPASSGSAREAFPPRSSRSIGDDQPSGTAQTDVGSPVQGTPRSRNGSREVSAGQIKPGQVTALERRHPL
jgi:hypothetical protein